MNRTEQNFEPRFKGGLEDDKINILRANRFTPGDVVKLFANSGQAQVSCAVAIAAAMRMIVSWRDGRDERRGRSMPLTSIDHGSDGPFVPSCSDGPLDFSFSRRVPVHAWNC